MSSDGVTVGRPPRSLALNASANALRVILGAAAAVVSTAVVTRELSRDQYGVWGLVLQVATYFLLFELGLTLAVSREVAAGAAPQPAVISTAVVALSVLSLIGLAGVALVATGFGRWFATVPDDITDDAGWAFALVAGSALLGLPAAAFTGYFSGVRRAHVPALIAFVVRVGGTVAIVAVALSGGGLVGLGLVTAVFALCGAVAVCVSAMHEHPGLFARRLATRATWRRLRSFSTHAFVFAAATFTIVNLDAILVARYDYARLAAYVIGATVVATLGATHYAAVTALLPVVAEMSGRGEANAEVLGVVQRAARFSAMFVVAVTVPLVVAAHIVLQIWVGGEYADGATGPLRLLLLASVVRFTGAVLSQAYFGLGDRWPVTIAITVEAVVNLSASLVLAQRYGAPGVALGTVIGAVAGVATAFALARSRPLGYALPMAVVRGTVRPVLGFLPLLLTSPWWYGWERLGAVGTTVVALTGVAATYLWLLTCLTASDRTRLRALLHR